jgi:phage gpG-like protein
MPIDMGGELNRAFRSSVALEVEGNKPAQKAFNALSAALPKIATKASMLGAQIVRTKAITNEIRTKGAVTGTRVDKKGNLVARYAKLGGAIADKLTSRTGALRSSIRVVAQPLAALVGPTVKYGAIHEFGGTITQGARSRRASSRNLGNLMGKVTVDGKVRRRVVGHKIAMVRAYSIGGAVIRIPPRPYLRPAYEHNIAKIQETMIQAMRAGCEAVLKPFEGIAP